MNSLRYVAILIVVLLLASLSGWWLSELRKQPPTVTAPDENHYDYYLTNFSTRVLDKQGNTAYLIRAAYMEHYPRNNRALLTQPHFTLLYSPATWEAQADQAEVLIDQQTMDLTGNVVVKQTSKAAAPIVLTTDKMHINAADETLETTSQVKIQSGKDTIIATGLKADLANGQLELLSRVQGQYHIPPR
jgi:lipopolysaccharide export system protein LptC